MGNNKVDSGIKLQTKEKNTTLLLPILLHTKNYYS